MSTISKPPFSKTNAFNGIFGSATKGGRRGGRFSIAREGGFPSLILVGGVRISTILFILSLIEAILWTSCLISSHSALASDTVEAEHYLVRETENLKENASRILRSSTPVFEQSYLVKQHFQIERRWAQRILKAWSLEHFDLTPLREQFSLESYLSDKGIPGPFAGIGAIH